MGVTEVFERMYKMIETETWEDCANGECPGETTEWGS